jgi:hypothetical protein
MNTSMKKGLLKIGLLFTALVALIVGMALPVNANSKATVSTADFHIVQGKVTNVISNTSFELMTGNQQTVTIITNESTQYYIIPTCKVQGAVNSLNISSNNKENGKSLMKLTQAAKIKEMKQLHIPANWRADLGWLKFLDNQAKYSDIAVNDRVIVRADSNNLAKQVLIIKAPVISQVRGTVSLTDASHITVAPSSGSPITLNIVGTTRITLKGQTSITGYAIAVYNNTNNNAVTINIKASATTPD